MPHTKPTAFSEISNQKPWANAPATEDVDPQAADAKNDEFDEYGAELGEDARVWKTYVKEADKFDHEQVNGWNSSLDVTLIFAALFTAICTAFVMESSKSLKEDPPERSADRLDQISDILLVIANVKPLSELNVTRITNSEPFSPRHIDVWVNALWFFSLILSASVSLIAMLAKEWCYRFISGRIGGLWAQTKNRQRRLEGIERWKMERVIMFLPSLIHLAFLSFAVGLCLYLRVLYSPVAIPVVVVTLGSVFVYMASTLLPLWDDTCPYSTTIYQLIKPSIDTIKARKKTEKEEDPEREADAVKIQAVAWLIKTCGENPKSLDIALQALAGAHENNDGHQKLLKKHKANTMIYKRLLGLNPYSKNYGRLKDLYDRAYSFFNSASVKGPIDETRRLRSKIRKLQTDTERRIFEHVSSGDFSTSDNNFKALRIGIEATSHCLQSLVGGAPPQLSEPLENAIVLLEEHCRGNMHVNRPVMDHLVIGTSVLLSRSATESNSQEIGAIIMRLLRIPDSTGTYLTTESRRNVPHRPQFTRGDLGLLLTVFALCRSSDWNGNYLGILSSTSRTEKAIEAIIHYSYSRTQRLLDDKRVYSTMINLGLLELLSHPLEYQLIEADFRTIEDLLVDSSSSDAIHSLPETSDLYPYALEAVYGVLSLENSKLDLVGSTDAASTYLTALSRTLKEETEAPPKGGVYVFVIECVYSQPQTSEAYGQQTALDILRSIHSIHSQNKDKLSILQTMSGLADSLGKRSIVARLRELPEVQTNDRNFESKLFGAGQAWLLMHFAIESGNAHRNEWKSCWAPYEGSEGQGPIDILEERDRLAMQYREMRAIDQVPRHPYFDILDELISADPEEAQQTNALS